MFPLGTVTVVQPGLHNMCVFISSPQITCNVKQAIRSLYTYRIRYVLFNTMQAMFPTSLAINCVCIFCFEFQRVNLPQWR